MKIGNIVILPWSWRNFIPRLIAIGLVVAWVLWGVSIWRESNRLEARRQALVELQQRRESQQRREAAYKSRIMQEQAIRSGVQNAIDGVKK